MDIFHGAFAFGGTGSIVERTDYKLGDSEGKSANNEPDTGVKNSIFSFFDFSGVASRSHITDAADDDEYNCYNA